MAKTGANVAGNCLQDCSSCWDKHTLKSFLCTQKGDTKGQKQGFVQHKNRKMDKNGRKL